MSIESVDWLLPSDKKLPWDNNPTGKTYASPVVDSGMTTPQTKNDQGTTTHMAKNMTPVVDSGTATHHQKKMALGRTPTCQKQAPQLRAHCTSGSWTYWKMR
jgi:hypothetical protein